MSLFFSPPSSSFLITARRRLSLSKLTPSSVQGHLRHGRRLREFVYPLVIFVFAKVLAPGASSRSTSSSACLNEHIHKPWPLFSLPGAATLPFPFSVFVIPEERPRTPPRVADAPPPRTIPRLAETTRSSALSPGSSSSKESSREAPNRRQRPHVLLRPQRKIVDFAAVAPPPVFPTCSIVPGDVLVLLPSFFVLFDHCTPSPISVKTDAVFCPRSPPPWTPAARVRLSPGHLCLRQGPRARSFFKVDFIFCLPQRAHPQALVNVSASHTSISHRRVSACPALNQRSQRSTRSPSSVQQHSSSSICFFPDRITKWCASFRLQIEHISFEIFLLERRPDVQIVMLLACYTRSIFHTRGYRLVPMDDEIERVGAGVEERSGHDPRVALDPLAVRSLA
ncbi:uncharacterized protein LOC124647001 [Lolium rigidum]|uniref:uncharacterized protein LOC124647001 n=1 Tax=Lolium rigidum TaxID=89674 RepID=UPI001F5E1575|nr:uncharacterized protein LOC124647001 [Lolium rigidum]